MTDTLLTINATQIKNNIKQIWDLKFSMCSYVKKIDCLVGQLEDFEQLEDLTLDNCKTLILET